MNRTLQTGLPSSYMSGNLNCFNVRELSGNFMICQEKMKFCQNVGEMSGNFTFRSCKSLGVWS